jgi:hypothetical protein
MNKRVDAVEALMRATSDLYLPLQSRLEDRCAQRDAIAAAIRDVLDEAELTANARHTVEQRQQRLREAFAALRKVVTP